MRETRRRGGGGGGGGGGQPGRISFFSPCWPRRVSHGLSQKKRWGGGGAPFSTGEERGKNIFLDGRRQKSSFGARKLDGCFFIHSGERSRFHSKDFSSAVDWFEMTRLGPGGGIALPAGGGGNTSSLFFCSPRFRFHFLRLLPLGRSQGRELGRKSSWKPAMFAGAAVKILWE